MTEQLKQMRKLIDDLLYAAENDSTFPWEGDLRDIEKVEGVDR